MTMVNEDRWARTRLLIGPQAVDKLSRSTVIVVGLGGVGSYAAEALARSAIGRLILVDHDTVNPSNINRQLIALTSTLGRSKVEVMRERALDINPRCEVIAHFLRYEAETHDKIFTIRPDYVVDAIDSVPAKIALISRCVNDGVPIVSSMGTAMHMDPGRFTVADISQTRVCPLARVVRRELGKAGIRSGVKVVFSTEPCQGEYTPGQLGSVAFVPPVAGMLLAGTVVSDLIKGI